jgi:NAD(P)-dependent dehydrogenase (short-subunit alcohol dehydrogenase family)
MAHPPVTFGFDDIPDQTGRTVLVTGASSGLGAIVTEQLAVRGATVLMAVRDVAKGSAVANRIGHGDLEVHHVDMADLDSVRHFADSLHAAGRGIDVLINNAGVGGQQRTLTAQGYERVFATNHLGPFALTGLLLDLFRPENDPRVVAVGSNLYRRMRPRTDFSDLAAERSFAPAAAYVQSKLANLLFGSELERRLRRTGSPVRSFLAHPGMASTPMHDTAEGFTQKAFLVVAGALLSRPAEAGALPLLFAATSPAAETGVFLGPSARKWDSRVHFDALVRPADDLAAAARLWRLSEEATGVRYLDAAGLPGGLAS